MSWFGGFQAGGGVGGGGGGAGSTNPSSHAAMVMSLGICAIPGRVSILLRNAAVSITRRTSETQYT